VKKWPKGLPLHGSKILAPLGHRGAQKQESPVLSKELGKKKTGLVPDGK